MRAAVLEAPGKTPTVREFDEPDGPETEVVDVRLAGCNPVDLALASGAMGEPVTPSVVGKEGIGTTTDGHRVYFDSPPEPFGSWAQRCRVDPALTFPIPDALDDDLAVALGIAGLAAWLPLTRHADVSDGKSVLVLGATGVVGRIAVQAAKLLGAKHVVGAGRNPDALEEVRELGADAVVRLGQDDDPEALMNESGDGYDVVIDMVYGDPFLAALDASTVGATLITVGQGAGATAAAPFAKLMGRTHIGHNNNLMGADVMRAGYDELTGHAAAGRIRVDTERYPLDEAPRAWQAQADSPHTKIAIQIS
ncbi:zinc-binding alcohol dehydrogenase family protein [Mycolicibacterium novocastrense]|uniref:Zinc-binding alcohol dehydrogenase family protein n=1 Tax=Mycolicibacterium novocastrense TaxID=59813 RepID=A0AAW5SNW8_MYCNV|nr:zinc-binding alcohol dehydrogenase family protein [Mycolicibacterium novocastrense]MCV7025919.1 zinc-binding alcohol dehydrogenase family protein [Mycolicibacterium novocastrense]GAT08399.1 Zn-dependent oxidoreductase [Mycolicibacterium novocastrense]